MQWLSDMLLCFWIFNCIYRFVKNVGLLDLVERGDVTAIIRHKLLYENFCNEIDATAAFFGVNDVSKAPSYLLEAKPFDKKFFGGGGGSSQHWALTGYWKVPEKVLTFSCSYSPDSCCFQFYWRRRPSWNWIHLKSPRDTQSKQSLRRLGSDLGRIAVAIRGQNMMVMMERVWCCHQSGIGQKVARLFFNTLRFCIRRIYCR